MGAKLIKQREMNFLKRLSESGGTKTASLDATLMSSLDFNQETSTRLVVMNPIS